MLQCKVDWPWLQVTVNCGEVVTILGDWVVSSNSDALQKFQELYSVVEWCGAPCIATIPASVKIHTHKQVPCDLPLSNQVTAWSGSCWFCVTADVCKGMWVSNGSPLRTVPWCDIFPLRLIAVATEDDTWMRMKAPKVVGRRILSTFPDCGMYVCRSNVTDFRRVFACCKLRNAV